jgi:TonB family protein
MFDRLRLAGDVGLVSLILLLTAGSAAAADPAVDPTSCVAPVWPKEGKRMAMEGTVIMEFLVQADGKVRESRLVESSGYPLLDSAARTAMEKCRFVLDKDADTLADRWTKMRYVWTLEGPLPKSAPAPEPFAAAPAPIRALLLQAKHADAIADPLQRCLAFPDLPGNQWPAGLTQAYCHLMNDPMITQAKIAELVERGSFSELEALYRRDLDRHSSKDNFSEVIHRDFAAFDGGAESERLSALWLRNAPDSPFANAARAGSLAVQARQARGSTWYKDIPKEDLARMKELASRAIDLLGKAIRLEPRFQHALIGVMDLTRFAGGDEMGEAAFERADAIDPACRYVNKLRMYSLRPRWGGSMPAMHAYAKELQPFVATRPLVALSLIEPALAQAKLLSERDLDKEVVAVLAPAALLAPFPELFEDLGLSMVEAGEDRWEALLRFLIAYRYDDESSVGVARARGSLMLDGNDPQWALKSLQRGVELKPESPYSNYLLGKTYFALKKYALAEPFLIKGLQDRGLKQQARYLLTYATLFSVQLEKADGHAEQMIKDYPADPRGWFLRASIMEAQDRDKDAATAYTSFLGMVKDSDAQWAGQAAYARQFIKRQANKKPGAMR